MLTIPNSYKVVYNGFISSNVENCDEGTMLSLAAYSNARNIGRGENNIAFQHGF